MLSVEEYRDLVLAGIESLHPIELPLSEVDGCLLAQDVAAPWPLPSFDNSSMDGYAVLQADIAGASAENPVTLKVIDDVPAGFRSLETLVSGTAIRIMTGAPTPDGTQCVVPVEMTDGGTENVVVSASVDFGGYVRKMGEDILIGEIVLRKGALLNARSIALLAAVGQARVLVIPRPRAAVMSTGTELVEPGTPLAHGLISDSNSFMLVAAANSAGALAYRATPVQDDEEELERALNDQVHRADILITTGGVSMGAYDPVKAVFQKLGSAEFYKVAMQPGMPQGCGSLGDPGIPVITLPGNPVSAYVSFEVFVRPALRKLRGLDPVSDRSKKVELAVSMTSPEHKCQFARGRFIDADHVEPVGAGQGSHVMGGLAQAECFIVIPAGVATVDAGAVVEVIDIREGR